MCDATTKPGLACGVQDFELGLLEHADHVGEGGPDVGVGIPAARHDLTQHGQAVRRDYRSHVPVHHHEGRLHRRHVRERQHSRYQLPHHYPEVVHVHLLGVRPVLDHLPADNCHYQTDKDNDVDCDDVYNDENDVDIDVIIMVMVIDTHGAIQR